MQTNKKNKKMILKVHLKTLISKYRILTKTTMEVIVHLKLEIILLIISLLMTLEHQKTPLINLIKPTPKLKNKSLIVWKNK